MKNFSFGKNKNIYIIRYKEWEHCMDIEKEIIINNKTGEIIDYNAMRTMIFEDLVKAHNTGKRVNFISGLYEESDKTKKNESYVSMEVLLLYKNYGPGISIYKNVRKKPTPLGVGWIAQNKKII